MSTRNSARASSRPDGGHGYGGGRGGERGFGYGPRWMMAALAYTHRSSTARSRSWSTRQRGVGGRPAGQARRPGQENAGGRIWNTLTGGGPAIRRDLDLRSRLPGGGLRSRDRGARDRHAQRRIAARLDAGVPGAAARLRRAASVRVRWLNTKGALGLFAALAPSPAMANCSPSATRCSWSSMGSRTRFTRPVGRVSPA